MYKKQALGFLKTANDKISYTSTETLEVKFECQTLYSYNWQEFGKADLAELKSRVADILEMDKIISTLDAETALLCRVVNNWRIGNYTIVTWLGEEYFMPSCSRPNVQNIERLKKQVKTAENALAEAA